MDADDRDSNEVSFLNHRGICVLPVCEVENLLLMPRVFTALAELFLCSDAPALLNRLVTDIARDANSNIDLAAIRFTIRQVDKRLKSVELNARDAASLTMEFQNQISSIDPNALFMSYKSALSRSIAAGDLPEILRLYDNKGLLSRASSLLGLKSKNELLDKVRRHLGTGSNSKLRDELAVILPSI